MSRRIADIQRDCPFIFPLGSVPVPAIKVQSVSERGVGFAKTVIQRQCLGCGRLCLGESVLRGQHAILPIARKAYAGPAVLVLDSGIMTMHRLAERKLQPARGLTMTFPFMLGWIEHK